MFRYDAKASGQTSTSPVHRTHSWIQNGSDEARQQTNDAARCGIRPSDGTEPRDRGQSFKAASAPAVGHPLSQPSTPPASASAARKSADVPDMLPGLEDEGREVYRRLDVVVRERARSGLMPRPVVVITDVAKDYDDLTALVVLKELHRLQLIDLRGVVANLMPAAKRAQFARGALDVLGLREVPVARGLAAADEVHEEFPYEFDCSFFRAAGQVSEDGESLLLRLCEEAVLRQRTMTLLCLSSLADAAAFSTRHPALFLRAFNKVCLQGGFVATAEGGIEPDATAANNRFHLPAARSFHNFLSRHAVPADAYTKVAAFATPLTSSLFADLAATGQPVGAHLRRVQVAQDLAFYKRACASDPAARFQPFMDQRWFLSHKTSFFDQPREADEALPTGEQVIPYLTKVVAYDALAALGTSGDDVLAALEVLDDTAEGADGVARRQASPPLRHRVIGDATGPGVRGKQMAGVIAALLLGGLLEASTR